MLLHGLCRTSDHLIGRFVEEYKTRKEKHQKFTRKIHQAGSFQTNRLIFTSCDGVKDSGSREKGFLRVFKYWWAFGRVLTWKRKRARFLIDRVPAWLLSASGSELLTRSWVGEGRSKVDITGNFSTLEEIVDRGSSLVWRQATWMLDVGGWVGFSGECTSEAVWLWPLGQPGHTCQGKCSWFYFDAQDWQKRSFSIGCPKKSSQASSWILPGAFFGTPGKKYCSSGSKILNLFQIKIWIQQKSARTNHISLVCSL